MLDANETFTEHYEWVKMASGYWYRKLTKEWNIDFFDFDDLTQIASYGMYKAINTYNPNNPKKATLRTWVHTHINNEILRLRNTIRMLKQQV